MSLPVFAQNSCCAENGGVHESGQRCADGTSLPAQCVDAQNAKASRVYVWLSPTTGNVQMSGDMPAWYRTNDADGPRTWVYENGILMDDGKPLAPVLAQRLRRDAENYTTQSGRSAEAENIRNIREQWETDHIREGKIDLGMSGELVIRILGEPATVDQVVSGEGIATETWTYQNGTWVEFQDSLVSSFRQRTRSTPAENPDNNEIRVIVTTPENASQ